MKMVLQHGQRTGTLARQTWSAVSELHSLW